VKIYTRTGDAGETSLFGGTRVSKSDGRVDAYGEVDEANACLGVAVASLNARTDRDMFGPVLDALVGIQRDLFAIGAQLADPSGRVVTRIPKTVLRDEDIDRLEQLIDRLEGEMPPLSQFILAGGVESGAALHLARAVCRRAERRIVALDPPTEPLLLRYMNRLSDLLFVMGRWVNHRADAPEMEW
jgi:cob(I)alamin adenosyltransferase